MRCILFFAALLAYAQEPIPPLMEAGNAAYLKGDYETARQSFLKAWDAAQQTPGDRSGSLRRAEAPDLGARRRRRSSRTRTSSCNSRSTGARTRTGRTIRKLWTTYCFPFSFAAG